MAALTHTHISPMIKRPLPPLSAKNGKPGHVLRIRCHHHGGKIIPVSGSSRILGQRSPVRKAVPARTIDRLRTRKIRQISVARCIDDQRASQGFLSSVSRCFYAADAGSLLYHIVCNLSEDHGYTGLKTQL